MCAFPFKKRASQGSAGPAFPIVVALDTDTTRSQAEKSWPSHGAHTPAQARMPRCECVQGSDTDTATFVAQCVELKRTSCGAPPSRRAASGRAGSAGCQQLHTMKQSLATPQMPACRESRAVLQLWAFHTARLRPRQSWREHRTGLGSSGRRVVAFCWRQLGGSVCKRWHPAPTVRRRRGLLC